MPSARPRCFLKSTPFFLTRSKLQTGDHIGSIAHLAITDAYLKTRARYSVHLLFWMFEGCLGLCCWLWRVFHAMFTERMEGSFSPSDTAMYAGNAIYSGSIMFLVFSAAIEFSRQLHLMTRVRVGEQVMLPNTGEANTSTNTNNLI